MNLFGRMADDLTWFEESLEDARYAPYAGALKRSLHRAFIEACKASRAMRHAEEAQSGGAAPPSGHLKRASIRLVGRKAAAAAGQADGADIR
jgi:hypothetical protein